MSETALKIKIFGAEILRKKAKPVKTISDYHRDMLSQMARIMYASSGIGLAASQVGLSEDMFVADAGSGLYKIINPRIIKKQGVQVNQEGCLSVPGISLKVKRARKIVLKAQDENSRPITIEAEDLLACVFQHEIDHLRGKMIVDYASLLNRLAINKKLDTLKKQYQDEKLPESNTESRRMQL
ncbi:MAG: peptide deformylase [Deltaproteobacteria bacterium]